MVVVVVVVVRRSGGHLWPTYATTYPAPSPSFGLCRFYVRGIFAEQISARRSHTNSKSPRRTPPLFLPAAFNAPRYTHTPPYAPFVRPPSHRPGAEVSSYARVTPISLQAAERTDSLGGSHIDELRWICAPVRCIEMAYLWQERGCTARFCRANKKQADWTCSEQGGYKTWNGWHCALTVKTDDVCDTRKRQAC